MADDLTAEFQAMDSSRSDEVGEKGKKGEGL